MIGKWYDWGIYLYSQAVSALSGTVSNTSIFGRLFASSDVADYDRTVHSLEAIGDTVVANGVILSTIQAKTDALPTLTETGGTVTTDGTEQDVYINNAPAGVYRPIVVGIDFTDHTAGETVVLRKYRRVKTGGGWIKFDETTYAGAQDPAGIDTVLQPNRYGVKVTMEKTVGTNRDYDWEVCYEV